MTEYINKDFYKQIPANERHFIKLSQDAAYAAVKELKAANIPHSATISEYRSIVTVNKADSLTAEKIAENAARAFPSERAILGNTEYKYIRDKKYIDTDADTARKIAALLSGNANNKFSGIIRGEKATITVSGEKNAAAVRAMIENFKNLDLLEALRERGFERVADTNGFVNIRNIQTGEICGFSGMAAVRDMFDNPENEFFYPLSHRIAYREHPANGDYYYCILKYNSADKSSAKVYRDENNKPPIFKSVDEVLSYTADNGIEITNIDEEIANWREVDREREDNSIIEENRKLIENFPISGGDYIDLISYDPNNDTFSWVYFNPDGDDGNGEFIDKTITKEDIFAAYSARIAAEGEQQGRSDFIAYLNENCKEDVIEIHSGYFAEYADDYINYASRNFSYYFGISENSTATMSVDNFISSLETNCDEVKKDKQKREQPQEITASSFRVELDGYSGAWNVIENAEIDGRELFMLENDYYGDSVAYIVADKDGNIVDNNVWGDFEEYENTLVKRRLIEAAENSKNGTTMPVLKEFAEDMKKYGFETYEADGIFTANREDVAGFIRMDTIGEILYDISEKYRFEPNEVGNNHLLDLNRFYDSYEWDGFSMGKNVYENTVIALKSGNFEPIENYIEQVKSVCENSGGNMLYEESKINEAAENLTKVKAVFIERNKSVLETEEAFPSGELSERETADIPQESNIHFGSLGNGVICYDISRLDKETDDYLNVAHISNEGKIRYYIDDLSEDDRQNIENHASGVKDRFTDYWNGLPLHTRYAMLYDKLLETGTVEQIRAFDADHSIADISGKIKKYEHSIIFKDEGFPLENSPAKDFETELNALVSEKNKEAAEKIEVGSEVTLHNDIYSVRSIDGDFMMSMEKKNGSDVDIKQYVGNWKEQLVNEAGNDPLFVYSPKLAKELDFIDSVNSVTENINAPADNGEIISDDTDITDNNVKFLTDNIPDLDNETAERLVNAFAASTLHGWYNDDNQVKINRIKKSLYNILSDEDKTEKAYALISKNIYNHNSDTLDFRFGGNNGGEWFTENELLHNFVKSNRNISFALANALIGYLDEKQHAEREVDELKAGWYDKTDYKIKANIDGEIFDYEGRFDIGDGKGTGGGTLADHIRQRNEYIIKSDRYPYNTKEAKDNAKHILDVFVPFLGNYTAMTPEEEKILEEFKENNPIRTAVPGDEIRDDDFEIFQVKSGDEYIYKRYMDLSALGHSPSMSDYDRIYMGKLSEIGVNAENKDDILDNIYTKFNVDHPEDFKGHSLSVSDIVVLHKGGIDTAHYVDDIGFKDVPEFLREETREQTQSFPVGNSDKNAEEAVNVQKPKKIPNTIPHRNFNKLKKLFPEFMEKNHTYERYESGVFEPLSAEWIDSNMISLMQTYVQNGDLMRDPDVVLKVDFENETVNAVSFENSGSGIYQEYPDGSKDQKDANSFVVDWLNNIEVQDFKLTRYDDINENRVDLTQNSEQSVLSEEKTHIYSESKLETGEVYLVPDKTSDDNISETDADKEVLENASDKREAENPTEDKRGAEDTAAAPEDENNSPMGNQSLTELQKAATTAAKKYEKLSMQKKINVIAQAFGCKTGRIETSPCSGKWRGTSDISIIFDNGSELFLGNRETPKAVTARVQTEFINTALVQYNPEIIRLSKEAAAAALKKCEAEDNRIAAQMGLKPYTLLNVEFNDGTDEQSRLHMGWYYLTLAVEDKIIAHIESGLNYDIHRGTVNETAAGKSYFVAGGVNEEDVDYVFQNAGFSSSGSLYLLPVSDEVRERAEKTLAALKEGGIGESAAPALASETAEQDNILGNDRAYIFSEVRFETGEVYLVPGKISDDNISETDAYKEILELYADRDNIENLDDMLRVNIRNFRYGSGEESIPNDTEMVFIRNNFIDVINNSAEIGTTEFFAHFWKNVDDVLNELEGNAAEQHKISPHLGNGYEERTYIFPSDYSSDYPDYNEAVTEIKIGNEWLETEEAVKKMNAQGNTDTAQIEALHVRTVSFDGIERSEELPPEAFHIILDRTIKNKDNMKEAAEIYEKSRGNIMPVYTKTPAEATEAGEREIYFANKRENERCAASINYSVGCNNDGMHFHSDKAISDLLNTYSIDRIALIIAARISSAGEWDRRFSRTNAQWAKNVIQAYPAEQVEAISRLGLNSHSVLLNSAADELRKNYEMFRSMQTKKEAEVTADVRENEKFMENIKNLSQLKKILNTDSEFLITDHLRSECIGERRRVTEINTVGFYSQKLNADGTAEGKPIYMEWAKAANWNFRDGICSSSLDNNSLVMSFRIIEKNIPNIDVSEMETDGEEIHSPMGNTEEERHISAADITIGDRFLYKGEEVTVSSFNGIYPDDIGISKMEKSGSIEYEVTRNIDKFVLANDGVYLGNSESDRSEEKAEYTDKPITSRNNSPMGNYTPQINDIVENDDGVYKIADISGNYVTLLETDTFLPDEKLVSITDYYKSNFTLLERDEIISETADTEKSVEIVEKPVSNSENYVISDNKFGDMGGAKSRYAANIEAIKTLKSIEADGRNATPAEQDTLAGYTGWGAIPQAFDGNNTKWSNEYAELKNLLTPEEYAAARHSTMNAHYTSPIVISAMYDVLNNLGFDKGNILEPAMGTGNFFGMLPEAYRDSKLYGVELDSITGRISQRLYPNADIQIKGYEKTSFPDNSFDVAVGNVPFGDYGISDKRYNEYNFNIHDYFFAKTLDKVHAGGIIAFVTSKGTMDKENDEIRRYIAQRAELLGAVRLPNNAFKATAGTEVTSDILILQKRERAIEIDPDSIEWLKKSETADGLSVNNYFVQHPEMVLGKITEGNKMYGNRTKDTSCTPIEGADLKQQLAEAIKNIKGTYRAADIEIEPKNDDIIPAPANSRKFSFYEQDGNIYYREAEETMKKVNVSKDLFNRAVGMIELRDSVHELLNLQLMNGQGYLDSEVEESRKKLNTLYDSFVKKYGNISSPKNAKAFKGDNGYFILSALENKDESGKVIGKADIFTKNTLKPKIIAAHVETVEEALILSVSEKGKVDFDFMTELCGMDKDRLISELDGQIYKLPQETEKYVTADEYLSGNIRKKMLDIENSGNPNEYEKNYAALQAAMPPRVEAKDIAVKLGSHWVDPKYIRQFILEKFKPDARTESELDVSYSKVAGTWKIEGQTATAKTNHTASGKYGTHRKNAYDIIEGILNNSDLLVKDRVKDEYGNDKRDENGKYILVTNEEETKAVRHCANIIKSEFADWIFKDPDRREALVNKYNEIFNSFRYREYDGSHLNFVGMNTDITLKEHQKNAVARGLYGGNTLLAHAVGGGKTYEMIAIAMEGKRLGLHNKSLFAVPNSLTEQIGSDFRKLYPNANILVATKKDFEKNNRAMLLAKMAANDWDAVIVGHSQFDRMGLSPQRESEYLYEEIEKLRSELEKIDAENPTKKKSFTVKNIEKSITSYTKRLDDLKEKQVKDDFIDFEQLGFDKIFVDECHMYKNLATATKMRNVAGLGSRGSARAFNLLMKAKYLDILTDGKGTVFASGTPVITGYQRSEMPILRCLCDQCRSCCGADLLYFSQKQKISLRV